MINDLLFYIFAKIFNIFENIYKNLQKSFYKLKNLCYYTKKLGVILICKGVLHRMKVVYYSSWKKESISSISKELFSKGITYETEVDYAKVIFEAKNKQIDVLVINLEEYVANPQIMNIFKEGEIFAIPSVLVVGVESEQNIYLPTNYHLIHISQLVDKVLEIYSNSNKGYKNLKGQFPELDIMRIAHETLSQLGFNISTFGTIYLQDCIAEVMNHNCNPTQLNKTVYNQISAKHNSSIANVVRCTRASLETAWKRHKRKAGRLSSGVSFDDFTLCPSVKEFIYYVAYKLNNYTQNLNYKNVI